jgi:hypothetical protein
MRPIKQREQGCDGCFLGASDPLHLKAGKLATFSDELRTKTRCSQVLPLEHGYTMLPVSVLAHTGRPPITFLAVTPTAAPVPDLRQRLLSTTSRGCVLGLPPSIGDVRILVLAADVRTHDTRQLGPSTKAAGVLATPMLQEDVWDQFLRRAVMVVVLPINTVKMEMVRRRDMPFGHTVFMICAGYTIFYAL